MGRKESQLTKKPVFMHDKMYNIVPDIMTTKLMHGLEEIPTIPRQRPLPLTAIGKKYETFPNLGEVHAPSKCNNNAALTRPNLCISSDILSQPDVKKSRVPLACLDLKSIKQKIDKAEKKEKKAKKKKSKPAPKHVIVNQEEKPNEQKENSLPLAHIPRPPDNPLDPSKPRRIVRIKQETFNQSLGPEKTAEIVNMVTLTGHHEGFGCQTVERGFLNAEQHYGYINSDPFSGYIHPADTLPGVIDPNLVQTLSVVIDPNQEMGHCDNFPGYINPADSLPGVMYSNQDVGDSFPGYIHPANTLQGVFNPNQEMGYSNNLPGYIHPADTLPGIIDPNQDVGHSFPGYIHPAGTLPEMMDPNQVRGMNFFKSEICSDNLGGFPQIQGSTPEGMSGYVKANTCKDSLVENPLILPKPQRQLFKCASPEQFKSLCKRSTLKSTHRQRSKNADQKLLSINSNVTI